MERIDFETALKLLYEVYDIYAEEYISLEDILDMETITEFLESQGVITDTGNLTTYGREVVGDD